MHFVAIQETGLFITADVKSSDLHDDILPHFTAGCWLTIEDDTVQTARQKTAAEYKQ